MQLPQARSQVPSSWTVPLHTRSRLTWARSRVCAAVHKDKPATTENVVVGANGGLANVVVYISQGLTGNEAAASSQPVQLEQKGCQYLPHVVVVDAGQHLKIVNADQTSHNIYAQATKNPPWNKSQPPGAQPLDASWTNEEIAIPVKCNVHPWMHAYVAVVKGPYGVSDDSGSFKLEMCRQEPTL